MLSTIESGQIPSDRLYGMVELIKNGWNVDTCDERLTAIEAFFRKYTLSFINLATLKKSFAADVLIVKDNFSLMLTLFARIFNKKIIYLDSLFYIPKNPIRRFLLKLNLIFAPVIVSYSKYQVDLWCREFNVSRKKFTILPYTIDINFYRKGIESISHNLISEEQPFILATGRDTGRDFKTLVRAAIKLKLKIKLVTLPYLIPDEAKNNPDVEILQYVSYEELFSLYSKAKIVAIPLRSGIDYPSGIRAVLESMLVGKPTICTYTPVLEEYIPRESESLLYVPAEDEDSFTAAINTIINNDGVGKKMSINARKLVQDAYSMQAFFIELEKLIETTLKS